MNPIKKVLKLCSNINMQMRLTNDISIIFCRKGMTHRERMTHFHISPWKSEEQAQTAQVHLCTSQNLREKSYLLPTTLSVQTLRSRIERSHRVLLFEVEVNNSIRMNK